MFLYLVIDVIAVVMLGFLVILAKFQKSVRNVNLHIGKNQKQDLEKVKRKMEKADYSSAIKLRNKSWENNRYIPSWVDINGVDIDHFCTRPDIAKLCWENLYNYLKKEKVDLSQYQFIEPSAGLGAFYNLLPKGRRIGIDIVKSNSNFIQQDFLSWQPKNKKQKYICVGNPPFGYRAWLALAFVNHAGLFSDYIAFIVPMAFQSDGKSNVKDRVNGFHLVHSSPLPADSFVDINGKIVKVNALWQIWKRGNVIKPIEKTCDNYLDLFTVDMRKERKCGHNRLHEADFFLQRTFYTEPPKLVKSFDQVKYVCGYGLVIKQNKNDVLKALKNTDWRVYSNLASHNCRHISMGHIRKALIDVGFIDNEIQIRITSDDTNYKPIKIINQNC